MLTYANQLTILRMVFVPCFVLLVIYGHPRAAALVFALAAVTDGLDGLLARKLGQRTVLGSFLDPMADKLLLTAAFITLTVPSIPLAVHIRVWLTVTTISRDVLIALSALIIHLQTRHSQFPPSVLGKLTTAAQLVTVGICMIGNFNAKFGMEFLPPVEYATLFLTIASGLHYFYRSVRVIESYQRVSDGKARNQDSRS